MGCHDKGARARLFREKECSLKKALEALQISESTHEQLRDIRGEDSPVSAVHHKKSTKKVVQFIFIYFIYYGFTAQVLKVCRTPGPTAC